MHIKLFRCFSLLLIIILSVSINSCNKDDKETPDPEESYKPDPEESNKPDEELSIIGKWTIEDYRTGEYFTFDFKKNGEYTLLQSFYEQIYKAAGRYEYEPKTQTIFFEHYYNDYDFIDHGDDPSFGNNLSVKCKLDENTLKLIGADCEELGLTNPVLLKKGGYSGVCPDFRDMLCSIGDYESKENTSEGYIATNFKFYSNGDLEFIHGIVINYPDGSQGWGWVYGVGKFYVEKYLLKCNLPDILKIEDKLGYASTSIWDKSTDGQSLNLTFYLALDEDDKIMISEFPFYK